MIVGYIRVPHVLQECMMISSDAWRGSCVRVDYLMSVACHRL